MTREEKEHIGKYILEMAKLLEDGCYQQEILLGAVHIIDEALEQEPTAKNDLGVDCISRQEVLRLLANSIGKTNTYLQTEVLRLPSVTPQLSSELEKNSKKLEKNFGELDCILRADAIRVASGYCHPSNVAKELAKLPSVTPQEPRCKDCKWWKDNDGEYRRGCGAESKCPINTKTVYLGKGYCYKFEPQESEDT